MDKFIKQNPHYFDKKWDKVFNEFTIFDHEKRMYRIDRLMINTNEKKMLIIDYKTGQVDDDQQTENYINIIKNMPVFTKDKYEITAGYVFL